MAESGPIRRLAATIPALRESVQQQATAVVEADAARVAAAEKYRAGSGSIEAAIEGYARDVRSRAFPGPEHVYEMKTKG